MAELAFASDPLVIRWTGKLLRKARATARLYGEFLYTYWNRVSRPRGIATLQAWLDEAAATPKLRGDNLDV